MDHSAYSAINAVNWSTLKHILESPLHYKHALEHPEPSTTSQIEGQLLHTLALEPERFSKSYAIFPGETRRGKEWDAFKAANAGKTIVKANELDEVQARAAAVRAHPLFAQLLHGAQTEVVLDWTDPATALRCKGRADLWHPTERILIDLKGCGSTDARHFGLQAAKLGYHAQMAHYKAGIELSQRTHVFRVYIVAVELAAPYDVAFFEVTDEDLEVGREQVDAALSRLKECRKADYWPGRHPDPVRIQLPGYIFGSGDVTITTEDTP